MLRRVFPALVAAAALLGSAPQVNAATRSPGAAGQYRTVNAPGAGLAAGQGTFLETMNDRGVVVGTFVNATNHNFGFRFQDGRFSPVNDPLAGTGPFQGTSPLGITRDGVVAGDYLDSGNHFHGFVLRAGQYFDGSGVTHGFRRDEGKFTTYNAPHATSTSFQSIADSGQMTGYWTDSAGAAHGLIFTP